MRSPSNMTLRSALLARTPMFSADLFTVSLATGTVLRWTSFEHDVSYSGNTWSSMGPALQRSTWSSRNTTEVTEMEIILYSSGLDYADGNIKKLIHDGLLDGAYLQLDRAFMPGGGDTSLGLITLFGGRMGKVEINAISAKITVEASNVLMQQNIPRNTYQLGCLHTLYDHGCKLDRAAHTATYAVASASQLTINYVSPVPPPVDPASYQLGVLRIMDGPAGPRPSTARGPAA